MTFAYGTHEVRVVFGPGTIATLPAELDRAGLGNVMLLTTPSRDDERTRVASLLGERLAGAYSGAKLHVPVSVIADARAALERFKPQSLLAYGGGSAIGLGKALAFDTKLPLAVVPTTYSGSEMTAVWGNSEEGVKRTFRNREVAPCLVLYDPDLTFELSARVTGASGMNALAHCIEAEYAPEQSPVTSFFALEGVKQLTAGLHALADAPRNEAARRRALLGAHYAGRALDMTSMGLEHKLAHMLGSMGLDHAEVHAAIVPWVTAYNAPAAKEAMARLVTALGSADAAHAIQALARRLSIRTLADLGFTTRDIPHIVDLVLALKFPNPRPVDADGVRWILERAILGA
jgi:maleylacetate reductase